MKLLITGAWQQAQDYINIIEKMGHEVSVLQNEKDELSCNPEDIEGIICNGLFLSHPIQEFKNLKYIQLTSAGYDRVPMEYVKEQGIRIYNARGVYSIPMAEFVIAGMLQLYKQTAFFSKNQKKNIWEKHRGLLELYDKTVCIIGCGNVGTECAKRFAAFGCDVIGVDLFPREEQYYQKMLHLELVDQVLEQADVVVLTLPLTEGTYHLMNQDKLKKIKNGAVLVNIARGAIVDTKALALEMNRLGGAVLDVFEEEPLMADSPLWSLENVIITPHNSFVGEGNGKRLSKVIINNLRG